MKAWVTACDLNTSRNVGLEECVSISASNRCSTIDVAAVRTDFGRGLDGQVLNGAERGNAYPGDPQRRGWSPTPSSG